MYQKLLILLKLMYKKTKALVQSKKEMFIILMTALSVLVIVSLISIVFSTIEVNKSNSYYKTFTIENSLENIVKKIDSKEIVAYNMSTLLKKDTTFLDVFTTKTPRIEYFTYIVLTTKDHAKKIAYKFPYVNDPTIDIFNKNKDAKNNLYNVKYDDNLRIRINITLFDIIDMAVTIIGFLLLIVAFQMIVGEIVAGKNFKPSKLDFNLTFNDIIGYSDVKKEFQEIIRYIKHKKEYQNDDLMVPKGILLTGDPGVGKTMFAKAFANEINANIYFASGADFAELYVGVGAKRVRNLFASARTNSPSVIFVDEFDAIGSREGNMNDSERLSVINQLLTELDGLNKKGDVFFIATTNHESKIDPAILRPGRIDKKINIPLPDKETRLGIIKKYLGDQYVMSEETLKRLVIKTQNSSGAILKNIIEQSKMLAFRTYATKEISNGIVDNVLEEIAVGMKQNITLNEEQTKLIAYHEVGHAYITHKLLPNDEVNKITIEPRGRALGYTMSLPLEEVYLYDKQELLNKVCMLLAGRAAEDVFMKKVTNGSADDLQRANNIVVQFLDSWGMSEKYPLLVRLNKDNKNNSEKELEISSILTFEYERAKEILNKDSVIIEDIVSILLDKKEINKEDFNKIIECKK